MRLIAVLDLLGGIVVRAIAGDRARYRPLESQLTPSCQPIEVATAMLRVTRNEELYLADLDVSLGQGDHWPIIAELLRPGRRLWLDAGIRTAADLARYPQLPGLILVCGTETLTDPDLLAQANRPLAVSIDIHAGQLLGAGAGYADTVGEDAVLALVERFVALGITRFILLDLAAVGLNAGPCLGPLCQTIRRRWPQLELLSGGGIRHLEDAQTLLASGVDGLLVSTALHQGRLRL